MAQSGGAKQGRAALMQSEVVTSNITSLIKNKTRMEKYKPIYFEGALNLTLGRVCTRNQDASNCDANMMGLGSRSYVY